MNESLSGGQKSGTRASDLRDVHARIEAWGSSLELGFQLGDDDVCRVLAERARMLAKIPPGSGDGEFLHVVEFMLGPERYAFESAYVSEVYPLRDLTPIPCTPAFVLGIINVRGQLLPVIDLDQFLDLRKRQETEHARVIVLDSDGVQLGVIADSIVGVRAIATSQIQDSLLTLTGRNAELLKGVDADRLAILDAAAILSDERLIVREEIEG